MDPRWWDGYRWRYGAPVWPTRRGQHSPDGLWWRDDTGPWVPAFSPFERRWWNGVVWAPLPPRCDWLHLPRWLKGVAAVWVVVIVVPWMATASSLRPGQVVSTATLVALLLVTGLSTVLAGVALAWGWRPWRRIPLFSLIGLLALAFAYAAVANAAPAPGTPDDPGAGIGFLILMVPIWVALVALLATGTAVATAARAQSHRPQSHRAQ